MAHDISNNVVAVLLVLVVAVAAAGTWAFLAEFEPAESGESSTAGQVMLDMAGGDELTGNAGASVQLQIATTEDR